jgi:hypothetical protein
VSKPKRKLSDPEAQEWLASLSQYGAQHREHADSYGNAWLVQVYPVGGDSWQWNIRPVTDMDLVFYSGPAGLKSADDALDRATDKVDGVTYVPRDTIVIEGAP